MSTDVDIDMNVELMAHGYSNLLVGVFGGEVVYNIHTLIVHISHKILFVFHQVFRIIWPTHNQ